MGAKVFIAAPLFNEMELSRNSAIADFLRELGFDVFLGQEDVGLAYDHHATPTNSARQQIFGADVAGIRSSDIILILLDGRTPDEGACVELGIAWALGKRCVGYKTDNRAMDVNGNNNIMIDGCAEFIAADLAQLASYLSDFAQK